MIALAAVLSLADLCGLPPEPTGDVDRDEAASYAQVGDEARATGDTRIAVLAYRRALALDPHLEAPRTALAELCGKADDVDAKALIDAITLYREGELDASRAALRPLAARAGEAATAAHFFLGLIALARHETSSAVEELELASRDPAYADRAAPLLRAAHRDGLFALSIVVGGDVDTNPQLVPDTPPAGATTSPPQTDEASVLVGAIQARPAPWLAVRDVISWREQRVLTSLDFLSNDAQGSVFLDTGPTHAVVRYDFDYDWLAGAPYLATHRVAVEARHELDAIALVASGYVRRRDYLLAAQQPFTGWVWGGDAGVVLHAASRVDLDLRGLAWRELTEDPEFASIDLGGSATVRARPSDRTRLVIGAAAWYGHYDGAEPNGELRRDAHGEASIDLELDLGDHIYALAGTSLALNDSTIPDFVYWKLTARLAVTLAFGGP